MDNQNYYDKKFKTSLVFNDSLHDASQSVIDAYLDNKPAGSKNKKVSLTEKHQLFWHSEFWQVTPSTVYNSEAFVLVHWLSGN
jgi:hypothetical protein